MIAPNNTKLVRICASEIGDSIASNVFSVSKDFQIVVDIEAGSTIFGGGAQYVTGVVLKDLFDNTLIFKGNIPTFATGYMGDTYWPKPKHSMRYTVPAIALTGRDDHFCRIYAFLRVRVTDQDVSFGTSDLLFLNK